MSIDTESSEARSCSTLRAPMIGAVTAGCAPTQATAALTGCSPRSVQKAANRAATSCIHSSSYRAVYILLTCSRPRLSPPPAYFPESRPPPVGL